MSLVVREPSDISKEVLRARGNIRNYLTPTPLMYSEYISALGGAEVFLKMESHQPTGSFKVRGALNILQLLADDERSAGVVTASSGNHGLAVTYASRILNIDCEVIVPEGASKTKTTAIRTLGGRITYHGFDIAETEIFARAGARLSGRVYISPYNDLRVIGGQGTVAVELLEQIDRIDMVYVAVGGGGLASGIAGYCKAVLGTVRIIGCQPVNSAVMAESVRAGRIVEMQSEPTLSDGTAGGIEPGSITFEYCRDLIDAFSLIEETEIVDAIRLFKEHHNEVIEGAAALPIAALLKGCEAISGKNVVLVICGGNISPSTLTDIL